MITNYTSVDQQGIGKIYYPNLEGITPITYFNTLREDWLTSGISTFTTRYTLCFRVTPIIKITSGIGALPFVSNPDVRYKFGSYSYTHGYEQFIDGETVINNSIDSEPKYLVYPRQCLETRWCNVQYDSSNEDTYLVFFDEPTTLDTNTETFHAPDVFFNMGTETGTCGMTINLSPNVTADMVLYYWFDIINFANFDDRDLFTYNL